MEERLFIKSKEDWYDVPRSHIQLVDPKLFREYPFFFQLFDFVTYDWWTFYSVFVWLFCLKYYNLIFCFHPQGIFHDHSPTHQTVGSLLAHYYPDHKWQRSFIRHHAGATRAPQIFAARVLRSIFPPDVKIEFNSRGGHGLIGAVGNSLEIDLFLPDYKLGFEYQVIYKFRSFFIEWLVFTCCWLGPSSLFPF